MSFANVSFHVNSGLIPQLTTGLIILGTVIFKLYKRAFLYIGASALLLISINQASAFAIMNCPPGTVQQGGSGTGMGHHCAPYNNNGCGGPDMMYRPWCTQQNNTNYWGQPWGNPGFYPYAGLQFHTNWGGGNWGAPWYFQPHGTSPYAPYCPQCMMNNPMYNPMWNPFHQNTNNWHGPAS